MERLNSTTTAAPDGLDGVPMNDPLPAATMVCHTRCFKKRGRLGAVLLVPVLVPAALSTPLVGHDTPLDHATEALGWAFFLLYLLFRVWPTMYVGGRKDKEMQTQGPYSICRNPLYLGSLFSALSAVMFFHSLTLLLLVTALACLYVRKVIPSEETILRARFGASFERYCARTPKLMPVPWHYQAGDSVNVSLAAMRREMKRLIFTSLFVMGAFLLCHLRAQAWWPHLFTLP